jgi:hypothetical protein
MKLDKLISATNPKLILYNTVVEIANTPPVVLEDKNNDLVNYLGILRTRYKRSDNKPRN